MTDWIETKIVRWTKSKLFFLFIVPLFLYLALLPVMPLMEPDEARYSDIPSLMNRTGDYVTPHLNHVVYLEKPPLSYWATALSYKVFGESEFSSRLFPALSAWGCILLVYFMGRFFHDDKTGVFSAGVLTTFLFFSILGRINILDIPLTFFVCLATWAGYRYLAGDDRKKGWLYLFYLSGALAFLTKGLIGIVFPFAIIILWLIICRRWRDVLRILSPVGIVIFLVITCPWMILVQKANKDFFWFFFVREHFLRYTTALHNRAGSLLYYVPCIVFGTLPWSAFLVKALKGGGGERAPFYKRDDERFLLIWVIFIFLFFSFSSSKLIPYIAPVFLPIALLLGHLFRRYEDWESGRGKGMYGNFLYHVPVLLQALLFIAVLLLSPFLIEIKLHGSNAFTHSGRWWGLISLAILFQVMITFLPDLVRRIWKRGWFLTVYTLSALFLGSLVFPLAQFLTPYRSAYPVTQAIKAFVPANQSLYQYRISVYGIDFYNKIRTPIVGRLGELRFGMEQLPPVERSRYFLSPQDFFRLCKEKGDIYCVTQGKGKVEELKKNVPNLEVLWDNGTFYLLHQDLIIRSKDPEDVL
jgi:4-amino-4-deoxy-L-arabinose transferase-like glycosyltransferase